VDTLTREDYARVGLALLAESGIAGVTIATACARLRVTKGSFYHHFSGVADLRAAMLEYWEGVYGRIRPAALEGLPPLERLDAQVDAAVRREHEVESAVRTWSGSDPAAAAVQHRLDQLRINYTIETLRACGIPRRRAAVLAQTGLAMLIGFQGMARPVDRRALQAAAEEWRAWLHSIVEVEAARASRALRQPPQGPAA
jgi:AcrR family transcriptional regulator